MTVPSVCRVCPATSHAQNACCLLRCCSYLPAPVLFELFLPDSARLFCVVPVLPGLGFRRHRQPRGFPLLVVIILPDIGGFANLLCLARRSVRPAVLFGLLAQGW